MAFDPSKCADCGIDLPYYPECAGGRGFVSPLSDELPGSLKEAFVDGQRGIQGIERPVCMKCFVIAWEQKNGGVSPMREKAEFIHADLPRAEKFGLIGSKPVPPTEGA
jgi:hypothetical protein